MKIRLVDYKQGVVTQVQDDYDPKQLDIEFVDFKYTTGLHLDGTVEKSLDTLIFRGELTSEIEQICGRCLKATTRPLNRPFELFYEIKSDEVIETIDDLREAVILEHPISFVCREDCKGLCPNCGINLNESKCQCKSQFHSDPFSQLKQIWNKKKEEKRRG